jgi:Straboviridae/Ackermannviridae/Kyanoviridae exonuclease subunit 1
MNIALITDLHFGLKIKSIGLLINYQLEYLKNNFIPYLIENKIDTIIIPGDISHNRKYFQTDVYHYIQKDFFDILENKKINVVIIPGNHDNFYTTNSDIHTGSFFSKYNNITVINKPTVYEYNGNKKILLTPWLSNTEEKEEFYKQLNNIDIIIGHFEFNGFEIVPGSVMVHGDNSNKIKDKAQLIISGHYHNKSQKDNIMYLGTPYQMSWNEYGYDKGFYILDTEQVKLDFIKNNNNLYYKIFYKDDLTIDINIYKDKICKVYINEEIKDKHKYDTFITNLEEQCSSYNVIDNTENKIEIDMKDINDKTEEEIFYEYVELNYPKQKNNLNKLFTKLKQM